MDRSLGFVNAGEGWKCIMQFYEVNNIQNAAYFCFNECENKRKGKKVFYKTAYRTEGLCKCLGLKFFFSFIKCGCKQIYYIRCLLQINLDVLMEFKVVKFMYKS